VPVVNIALIYHAKWPATNATVGCKGVKNVEDFHGKGQDAISSVSENLWVAVLLGFWFDAFSTTNPELCCGPAVLGVRDGVCLYQRREETMHAGIAAL